MGLDGIVTSTDNAHTSGSASEQPRALSINDVDLSGGFVSKTPRSTLAQLFDDGSEKAASDHLPRPPYDPLSTGQKLAGVIDTFGAIGGGIHAIKKFHGEGLHVLHSDIKSLDRLANSSELSEFQDLGHSLKTEVRTLNHSAQLDVLKLQNARPDLFDQNSARGSYGEQVLKEPRWHMLRDSEHALFERTANLGYINESLTRGINTSSTDNFKAGVRMISGLHRNPTAVREGLSPALQRLEDLGVKVNQQAAESTVSIASESRAVLLKNAAVVGAGIGTNLLVEKYLLKESAPSKLTIATDIISPSIVLTDLPLWAKFGVIVGAHAATRLAEYGMRKAGEE